MLEEKIKQDLTAAMKERRGFEVGVLRMVIAALHYRLIEKRSGLRYAEVSLVTQAGGKPEGLTEEEVLTVLAREVKKRKEAAEMFEQGRRHDLFIKETKEAELISGYMPAQMSEEEIKSVINKVLAGGAKDFGSAMKEAMKELKGRADGKIVGDIIKDLLK